jgi:hypothetical protein
MKVASSIANSQNKFYLDSDALLVNNLGVDTVETEKQKNNAKKGLW